MATTKGLPPDVCLLIEQLERHCLAPDGSLASKSSYLELQQAREEMLKERLQYLESMAIYIEAIAMLEEYQQTQLVSSFGGVRDRDAKVFGGQDSSNKSQVFQILERRLVVAETSQKLRLPAISKDGEIHEEEIEKSSVMSRSSFDSAVSNCTINSSNNSRNYVSSAVASNAGFTFTAISSPTDPAEPEVGGVPHRYLGITSSYLWHNQLQQFSSMMDVEEYQASLYDEIESHLKDKCDKLVGAFVDDVDALQGSKKTIVGLPERVKLILEETEKEEAALREDLYSADRKYAEYYNVLELLFGVLVKLVRDIKLQHQHNYDELQKTWLSKRCETMSAKLRVLEHVLLLETYTQESVPALRKIRNYLIEATEDASLAYNKAVTRLREYQGIDPHFDTIARQYHDIVKKLENMQWTIHQVEMDLKRLPDNQTASP